MSVNKVGSQQAPAVESQAPVTTGTAQSKGTTPSDVAGAPTVVIGASSVLPSPNLSETELQQALDKLQGKTPEIQKAVAEAVAAFGSNSPLHTQFNSAIYSGLMNDMVAAAKGNKGAGFTNLYASLDKATAAATLAVQQEIIDKKPTPNTMVLTVCATARQILDLLAEPGGAAKNAGTIAALLTTLGKQAVPPESADANQKAAAALAAMLGNVLGLAHEAAKLGDALTTVLNRMGTIVSQKNTPDTLAFSEKITGSAVVNLLLLLAAQIREEAAVRMETAEKETRARDEANDKVKEHKRLGAEKAKADAEQRQSSINAGSAVVAAMAHGSDDGWRLLNDLLTSRQANSPSKHPA